MGRDAGESRRQKGQEAGSTRFPPLSPRLPDLCNMGSWLRVLLAVNGLALAAAALQSRELARLPAQFAEAAALVEPVTLGALLVLCGAQRWLALLSPRAAAAAVVAVAAVCGAIVATVLAPLAGDAGAMPGRAAIGSAVAAALLIAWFDLMARAHSPAVTEARLMALTARIRPHFLFNSLNAVLGVIRSDPRRAEQALEGLAELFRALMQDNRELVPLSVEIGLARQYLDLERLRLGDRLQVRWDVETCPPDALVPPLMLQPLLENAVYHGIEPLAGPGEIHVLLARRGERLLIEIANPCGTESGRLGGRHAGNQMALANIRERLLLFFDLEASLATEAAGDRHLVRIELPYRRGAAA